MGESLLPGIVPILQAMDALEKIEAAGFVRKYGATYVWGRNKQPWSIDFGSQDENVYAWEVDRGRFDQILLDNSRSHGVEVREETSVTDLVFDEDKIQCLTLNSRNRGSEEIEGRYYVDATGQSAIIAQKLQSKQENPALQNMAVYGYFEGAGRLDVPNEGDVFISATHDGWIWHIPLNDDLTSIGVVVDKDSSSRIHAEGKETFLQQYILDSPQLKGMCQNARLISPVRVTKDWSYRAKSFAGSNYLLVGDAACFIDPILSSGCFLAMHGGFIGAICLNSILKQKQADPQRFLDFYCQTYNRLFDSFLHMAYFWYGGHRCQETWFSQAKKKMANPAWNVHARKAFVYLAAGFSGNHALQQIASKIVLKDSAGFSPHELPILYQAMDYAQDEPVLDSIKNLCELYNEPPTNFTLREIQDTDILRIARGVRIEDTMIEKNFQWYPAVKVISNGEIAATLDYFPEGCVLGEEYKPLLTLLQEPRTVKSLKKILLNRYAKENNHNVSKAISNMISEALKLGILEVVT
ncbi:MAG: NAD(P)/FAD-dependent oxidoreductase [Pleurocapsa sp. MO_226.B13]|nr:NAD(P)/FAD-dependent oxidoreductase [Pleurocapsa sp. MO_226.B13]